MRSVLQDWVNELTMMQQSVLLTAVRGPDGLPKYHPSKYLLRWYRRCILLSAMDGRVLDDPFEVNGGSFTGPAIEVRGRTNDGTPTVFSASAGLRDGSMHMVTPNDWRTSWQAAMDDWVAAYLRGLDEVPHHFQLHFMHGVEIVGYKHPDQDIGGWWKDVYERLVLDMHLRPESEADLDHRLGDNREQWLAHADEATRN
jgi:hypothetical protein